MRGGFRQWFSERIWVLGLAFPLVATASLVVWWTILLRGEMRDKDMLERQLLAARTDLPAQERELRGIGMNEHHARRQVMLVGESTLLGLLLSSSLVVLFLLAQRRKQQRADMEK